MKVKSELVNKVIDCHTHCTGIDILNYLNYRYPTTADLIDFHEKMSKNGVDYSITFPMPTTLYYDGRMILQGEYIHSGISLFPYQIENEYLVKQIEHFKITNILPFLSFSIHCEVEKQVEHLRNLIEHYPVYGLKYHSKVEQYPVNKFGRGNKFLELAQEYNIPVVIHSEIREDSLPMNILSLAEMYPDVRFCVAHLACFSDVFFKEIDKKGYENVFFDTSPLSILIKPRNVYEYRQRIKTLNYNNPKEIFDYFYLRYSKKILWGTDNPWCYTGKLASEKKTNGSYYAKEISAVGTENIKKLSENVIRFLYGNK